jgi:plastocyanin
MSRQDPMLGEVRFRVPLPVLIPITAVVVIVLLTVGFSRVLLAIPPEAATAVATVTALNILGACAVMAVRPNMSRNTMVELAVVVIYPVIIGIAIAQLGIGTEEHAEATPATDGEAPASSGGGPVTSGGTIVAEEVQFNSDVIELAAGEDVSITLDNIDSVEHNVSIYANEDDASAQENAIFEGERITASSTTYEFTAPDGGEYVFQCDVHPAMRGTVTVE